jgi:hypothetical protein
MRARSVRDGSQWCCVLRIVQRNHEVQEGQEAAPDTRVPCSGFALPVNNRCIDTAPQRLPNISYLKVISYDLHLSVPTSWWRCWSKSSIGDRRTLDHPENEKETAG